MVVEPPSQFIFSMRLFQNKVGFTKVICVEERERVDVFRSEMDPGTPRGVFNLGWGCGEGAPGPGG